MSKDEMDPTGMGHSIEQAEAALSDLARLAGMYYQKLMNNGVGTNLAHDLVMQYINQIVGNTSGERDP